MVNQDLQDPKIMEFKHWWPFVNEMYGNKFDSVKFVRINDTKNGELLTTDEMGFRWIILALFKIEDLSDVICQIFSEADFLMLYDKNTSFLWNDRERILTSIEHLKCQDLNSPFYKSDILNKFIEYRNFKMEERKNAANESYDLI